MGRQCKYRSTESYNEELKAFELRCLESFRGMRYKIKHICLKCTAKFEAFPENVLKSKQSCPICTSKRRRLTALVYNRLITDRKIRLVGKLSRQQDKHPHECLACGYQWETRPDSVLRLAVGCPACSKDRANCGWKVRKPVKVGKRTVHLQGFEPQALNYLKSVGCNLKKLAYYTDEGKPTFNYVFKGKERLYIPDFYQHTHNRVLEVKSTWTLCADRDTFKKNCAKALAVMGAGYDFCLIVMCESGERLRLPRDWYACKYKHIREYLNFS